MVEEEAPPLSEGNLLRSAEPDAAARPEKPSSGKTTEPKLANSQPAARPQLSKRQRRLVRYEASAWIVAAAAVLFWGDGHHNAVRIIFRDERVRREWMIAGFALLSINLLSFLYLSIRAWWQRGRPIDPGVTPAALPLGTFSGLAAGASFWIAFWHIFRWITPFLLAVLFMGGVMLQHVWPFREPFSNPA